MLCMGHREFGATDGGFCQKLTLEILDYVNLEYRDVTQSNGQSELCS